MTTQKKIPIIDAHHHIWNLVDIPWLHGPIQPRIFGDYTSMRRDYPVEEYLQDLSNSGVVKSVYVQANWATDKALEEVQWVQSMLMGSSWVEWVNSGLVGSRWVDGFTLG
jgi:predicted TIM-barrel fold metal-dependent hydrolase